MVSIYEILNLRSETYNYLVIQAREFDWIHDFTVKSIVMNSSLHNALKDVIEERLTTALLSDTGQGWKTV
jgi:hypothetical protein